MARNTIYQTLVGKLEKQLSVMEEGAFLPSEQVMADELCVSKPTLRRALLELSKRHLIEKRNGVGNIVSGSSKVISRELLFLCHDVSFFAESLKRFSVVAERENYFISIIPLCGDSQSQERIIATAISRRPAGMVMYADPSMGGLHGYSCLRESRIPVLYLIRLPEGIDGALLTLENADGLTGIVLRFYEEGCRRFGLYGSSQVNPLAARERRLGFEEGLRRCRLKFRRDWVCDVSSGGDERERFFALFRDGVRGPDAVCCLNDDCAGDFLREMHRRGLSAEGVRLSGFDNSPLTAFLPHELLTVSPPMSELGEEAALMLIRQIENPEFGFVCRKLASRLVVVHPEP